MQAFSAPGALPAQGQAVELRRAPFLPERRALRARQPVSRLAQAFIENG